jgi:hypothetical protein
MDIDKVLKECFLQNGYGEGVYPLTKLEYALLAESSRKRYNLSPIEVLEIWGLKTKIEIL